LPSELPISKNANSSTIAEKALSRSDIDVSVGRADRRQQPLLRAVEDASSLRRSAFRSRTEANGSLPKSQGWTSKAKVGYRPAAEIGTEALLDAALTCSTGKGRVSVPRSSGSAKE
jgi:hypothetical protein